MLGTHDLVLVTSPEGHSRDGSNGDKDDVLKSSVDILMNAGIPARPAC